MFRRKLLRTARNWVVHATSRKSSGYGGPRHGAYGNGHIAGHAACVIGRRLHKMLGAKQRRASWNRVAFLLRRRDARRGRLLIQLQRLRSGGSSSGGSGTSGPPGPPGPPRVVVVIPGERHERPSRPSRSSRVVVVIGKRHTSMSRGRRDRADPPVLGTSERTSRSTTTTARSPTPTPWRYSPFPSS